MKVRMRRSLALLVVLASCSRQPHVAKGEIDPDLLKTFAVAPQVMESAANPITKAKVALGRRLFSEQRLSKDQNISCNTCHPLDRYGADGKPRSVKRNAPSVYFAAGHISQF